MDPVTPDASSASQGEAGAPAPVQTGTILRFRPAFRVAHWLLAAPFLVLLVTGFLLFVPEVKGLHTGGYRLVPLIHVISGIVLIAGLFISFVLQPGRRDLWSDLGNLVGFARGDGAWLRYAWFALLGAHLRQPPTGKFNAGQKLNVVATTVFTIGLLLSGAVLGVNFFTKAVFSSGFVENVYPLHDVFTFIAIPIVAGHIYFAALNPGTRPSLRGIITGKVSRPWARSHHSLWVAEVERDGS